jgi:hypothetical protein
LGIRDQQAYEHGDRLGHGATGSPVARDVTGVHDLATRSISLAAGQLS